MSMNKPLKKKTISALLWDMSGNFLKRGNTFIISIFLARLLEPAEFGIVGMAMVFVSITQVLINVGFNSAIVQKQDTPPGAYHTIFFINLGIGFSLAGVFFFSATAIAGFYNQPEVEELVRWLSLLCIINSFNQVQMSLLKKELDFKALSTRLVAGSVSGGVVGVAMAFMGYGVYSIVVQNLVSASVGTITMWTVSGWRPKWYFRMADVKGMMGYSSYILADRLLSEITKKVDVLIVGRFFQADMLGYYTRATSVKDQVTQYSSTSLVRVFFPVFSMLQADRAEFERIYFKVFSVIVFLSYFLTGILYILGQDLILLLFGPKWMPSVLLFQILILAAANFPMSAVMINAFISNGHSKPNFYIGILRKVVRLTALATVLTGDMVVFVTSIVVASYLISFINVLSLKRYVDLPIQPHFRILIPGLSIVVAVIVSDRMIGFEEPQTRILVAVLFAAAYLVLFHATRNEGFLYARQLIMEKRGSKQKKRI